MNVRDVYKFLQTSYPKNQRNLNNLAWPTSNHHCGIQFYDSNRNIPPLLMNPLGYMAIEPLVGPFYELPVVGITPVIPKRFGQWKHFSLVVDIPPEVNAMMIVAATPRVGDKTTSATVDIKINLGELKGLASKFGINWYHHGLEYPWTLTQFESFDDCVKYEREVNKTRL